MLYKFTHIVGTTHLLDTMDDLPPGIGQYDDFHTIDWLRDLAHDRMRHRRLLKKVRENIFERLKGIHDSCSGWVCVLFVGCVAGIFKFIINYL